MIELMITLAIVGVLAAISYPAYVKHVLKGHRAAAQAHMLDMARVQTQYRIDTRTYATNAELLEILAVPPAVAAKYTITTTPVAGPPQGYSITATPIAGSQQLADGDLTLSSDGAKTPVEKW